MGRDELSIEDSEEALLDGSQVLKTNAARQALRYPTFRRIFLGAFASGIGSWMQNVVLTAYAYKLTDSPSFVGLIVFAQMGPTLLLSMVGGLIADKFDRRTLLIVIALEQLVFSLALAWLARSSSPSETVLFLVVLAIGIGQALYLPPFSAILPSLVPRELLAGAVSLNSATMNASRVIGPALGGIAYHQVGASWVFAANAATYLFIVVAVASVHLPEPTPVAQSGGRIRQLLVGVRVARSDRVVGRSLVTLSVFSFVSLAFIGQMPVVADRSLGIDPESTTFGALYATFGIGALLGALAIGSVLSHRPRDRMVRIGLVGFAASLAVFAVVHHPGPAFPMVAIVGFFYFLMITSLSTAMQERLDDAVRGRVMALWIMGFGGLVSLGNLVAGPMIDVVGVTPVLLVGAAVALALNWYADVRVPEGAPELVGVPAD